MRVCALASVDADECVRVLGGGVVQARACTCVNGG
jgi:hypothetical protein